MTSPDDLVGQEEGYLAIPTDANPNEAIAMLNSRHVQFETTPVSGRRQIAFVTKLGAEFTGISGIGTFLSYRAKGLV